MGFVSQSREIIGCQLIQPLQIGIRYYGSFYVSKSEKFLNDASNKLGIFLSTVSYSKTNPVPTQNYSQIYTDSIITDTSTWYRIEGSFIADSAYDYIMIGNFFSNAQTSYLQIDSAADYAYYYVDDIYLSDLPDSGFGNIPDSKRDDFLIYPNPASEWITINRDKYQRVSIYDALGKLCFEQNIFSSRINVSSLISGFYFISILANNGYVLTQKIFIYKP